jgi:antitoxin CcdA
MQNVFNSDAPKKATNLSINSDLLEKARRMNINLSATLEQALAEQLRAAQRELWKRENADAIKEYNRRVEKTGTFGDSVRKF